jgi:hypothetical protein
MFPPVPPLTAKEILKALRASYGQMGMPWVLFDEFSPGTGASRGAACRIDAWALNCWPSGKFATVAYEVKISRADYLREMRDPSKREFAMKWSNWFYFITPAGLLLQGELPADCGLVEVSADLSVQTVAHAAYRETPAPTWTFVAAIARRTARVEKEIA